jgi:hypothetical protein
LPFFLLPVSLFYVSSLLYLSFHLFFLLLMNLILLILFSPVPLIYYTNFFFFLPTSFLSLSFVMNILFPLAHAMLAELLLHPDDGGSAFLHLDNNTRYVQVPRLQRRKWRALVLINHAALNGWASGPAVSSEAALHGEDPSSFLVTKQSTSNGHAQRSDLASGLRVRRR